MNKPNLQPATTVAVPNIKKRGWKGFYRDVLREMKHVNWPGRAETNRLTGVVLAVCLIVSTVLFILSIISDQIFKFLLKGS